MTLFPLNMPLSLSSPGLILTVVFVSLVLQVSASKDGTCYFPAGNVAHNNVPCDPDAAVSACCSHRSFCLANGLCLVNDDKDTVEFARGACTDPTFQDPACFQHCHSCKPSPHTTFPCNSAALTFAKRNQALQIPMAPQSSNAAPSAT